MSKKKLKKTIPNPNERFQGSRKAKGAKKRTIAFSFEKHISGEGETFEDWEKNGLLTPLFDRMKQIGQYPTTQALALQFIKPYTKIGFPPNSKFKEPKHVSPKHWAVIHIKPNSKEVVAGFIEEDVFYLVFLDKNHLFWPTNIQTKKKVIR